MRITKKRAATVVAVAATGLLVGAGLAIAATQPADWDRIRACVDDNGRLAYFQFRDTADANCGDGPGGLQLWTWTVDGQQPAPEQQVHTASVGATTVENIGGSINERQTPLGEAALDLPAGTYLIEVDGAFLSDVDAAEGAPVVRPQLSLFYDKNDNDRLDWYGEGDLENNEGSISPNAALPPVADRHVTVSGSIVLNVDGQHQVGLTAFGYADDGSSARSGEVVLQYATLTATPVVP